MLKLSDRLSAIAHLVSRGERVGDIGTDHAHLPIFLWQNQVSRHIILSDLNAGPLQKADENIHRELGENPFMLRQSDGLEGFLSGEIDTAIIAGMGGLLIRNILSKEPEKARSIHKIILQPRNAQADLRGWLLASGWDIYDEILAREGKYICEIIAARPDCSPIQPRPEQMPAPDLFDLEIPPILFQKKDPLLFDFITKKINKEKAIAEATRQAHPQKYASAMERIEKLIAMIERIT